MPSKKTRAAGTKRVTGRLYKAREIKGGPILPNPGGFGPGIARLAGEVLRGGARGVMTPHGPDMVKGFPGQVQEAMHGASHAMFGAKGYDMPVTPPAPKIAQPAPPKDTSIPAVTIPTPPLYRHPSAKVAQPRTTAYSGHSTRGRRGGGLRPE